MNTSMRERLLVPNQYMFSMAGWVGKEFRFVRFYNAVYMDRDSGKRYVGYSVSVSSETRFGTSGIYTDFDRAMDDWDQETEGLVDERA